MKRIIFILFLVSGAFTSCMDDTKLNTIDPYYVFHNNCSKVWLIDHCIKDGKDYAPLSMKYKEIITFHESRNCYVQRMNTFGDEPGKAGEFSVNGKANTFTIDFSDQRWNFNMKFLSHTKIILVPVDNGCPYTLELIPVPEP